MTSLEAYYNAAKKMKPDFTQHTGTAASGEENLKATLYDPRRPEGLRQNCDNREHRDIVTAWIKSCEGLPGVYSTIWCLCYKTNKLKKRKDRRRGAGPVYIS